MKKGNIIGRWAFLIGVILAIVMGVMNNASTSSAIAPLLVLIGLIIGLLNVTDTEVMPFLWSSVALIIATSLGSGAFGDIVIADGILQALLLVFVPATVIVAIKNVFAIAKH